MKQRVILFPLLVLLALVDPATAQSDGAQTDGAQSEAAQGLFIRICDAGDSVDPNLLRQLASQRSAASLVALEELLGVLKKGALRRRLISELKHYAGAGNVERQALDLLEKLVCGKNYSESSTAASTCVKFGAAGQARLEAALEAAEGQTVNVRSQLVRALGSFKPLRSYELLARLAANDGEDRVRHAAIQAIARDPRALAILQRAIRDSYYLIPAAALDGLREQKFPGRRAIALDMAKKFKQISAVLAVLRVLAEFPDRESVAAILELGCRHKGLQRAVALEALRKSESPEVEPLLVKQMQSTSGDVAILLFALNAIGERRSPAILKAIRKLLSSKDEAIACAAIRAAGELRDAEATSILKKRTRSKTPATRAAAIVALSRIEAANPSWLRTLVGMLSSQNSTTRAAAADALGELRHAEAVKGLIKLLGDRAWQVQVAAIQALVNLRDKRAVPPLIELMAKTDGRLRKDIATALRRLTGMSFRRHVPDWQRWWRDQGADYELPALEEVLAAEERLEEARQSRIKAGRETVSGFYGIEVVSQRVTFVIDHSGSMGAPAGTRSGARSGTNKLDIAKSELQSVLQGMDEKTRFNVIAFDTTVKPWEKAIQRASDASKSSVRSYLKELKPAGSTNIHDALRKAFEDPDVDTIFFLTDGAPTAGEIVDPVGIREAVRRWNQTRKIVIHTIAIGQNLDLLKWLSKDSGGTHVYRR